MSSLWVSIQGSMIKQFGQENPNFMQFFRVVNCKSCSHKDLFKTRTLTAMIYSYSGGVVIITRTDVKWTLTGTLVNYYVWSH